MSDYFHTARQMQSRIPFAKAVGITHNNGTYSCPELSKPSARAGGDNAQKLPSRAGDRLVYGDGRVTDLTGQPLAT